MYLQRNLQSQGVAAVALLTVVIMLGGVSMADANPPQDLTALELEDLLKIEVVPVNVVALHTHPKDEWMLGYQLMYMNMAGNRLGTKRISDLDVLNMTPPGGDKPYRNVHSRMIVQMHLLKAMYAPINELTLMAMAPYKYMSMDHITRAAPFTDISKGTGDLSLTAIYTAYGDVRKKGSRFLLTAGLSLPTGAINQTSEDGTRKVEYDMQLGSGTFDWLPGISYVNEAETWAWGAEAMSTIRLGKNSNGYRRGHRGRMTAWGAYRAMDWLAPSVRLDGQIWGGVQGADPDINPNSNTASVPSFLKGRRVNLFIGLNFFVPKGTLKGNRWLIEGVLPIYQYFEGPQLQTDWQVNVRWSYSFYWF